MYSIIQDLSKRINMRLSTALMWSIYGALLLIISFILGRESTVSSIQNESYITSSKPSSTELNINLNQENILYTTDRTNTISIGRIYASSKGKRYYIEGLCDGNISDKNKIYYKDEQSAIANGKSKSSGCN